MEEIKFNEHLASFTLEIEIKSVPSNNESENVSYVCEMRV